ncbi:MAG: acetate--CoA ligase family protein [Novosphingobium sp.]|nr:acetate--CoA ligase family protein [Novosphingobium sp.]
MADIDAPTIARSIDLDRLVRPRSIALAGASPDPASLGGAVLANILNAGFAGDLHLVSPTRADINGIPCIKSLLDLPMGVDAAVLNVPRAAVREAIVACIARDVGGAIVFASGFSEAGEEGQREQAEIAALCEEAGFALLGPNCLGHVNYADGIPLTFEALNFVPVTSARRVGVIAQSGAMAANVRSALQGRGVPVSHMVTTGNEAVVRVDHFIRHLVEAGVTAIAAYVEQVRDPQAFLAAARAAREAGVPIVMVHPGSSARGREAAQSHTGAMVGDHAVMQTLVRGEGVALVDTLDELFDTAAILYRFPDASAGGVGIVTNSGAVRGLTLDFSETVGLPIAPVSEETLEQLRGTVPAGMEIDNPFDVGTSGYASGAVFGASTEIMLADPAVGSVLLSLAPGGPRQQAAKADAIVPIARAATKPVALAILGDDSPLDEGLTDPVRETELPFFRSTERALRALAAVQRRAAAIEQIAQRPLRPVRAARLPWDGAGAEYRGKDFLRELGIPVPEGALVPDVEMAVLTARSIGYPVVIKAQASALAHKSEAGGVILNLRDEAELRAGWARLIQNIERAGVTAPLDGVLVERMSQPGLEMVVGGRNDPTWGPVVAFGLGGVWIEALDAVELLPANAGREQVLDRLHAMKGAKLLGPFRGSPARDIEAVADVVMRLGAALIAHPEISEADINPLMVFAAGEGVLALDALIVTEGVRR